VTGRGAKTALSAVAIGLALACVGAPAAEASCGGTRTAKPKPNGQYRAPLTIGDSTMLLALPNLARIGFEANARGCRGMEEGLKLIARRRRQHRLPHLVVLALGTDFTVSRRQIRRALHIIGPDKVLGLVTPVELGGHGGNDAQVIRDAGKVYKNRVKVLDWVRFSRGKGSWFQPDGTHLTFAGARAFARLHKRALPLAPPPGRAR
jgi:hypothetical protein